ncbi:hypothetical protein [Stenotrophomonas virus Jojan60]|nr:hypothetical protein [Stenotrophomonas virus Jojan60]
MSDWTPTDEQALVKKIATVLAKGYGTGGNKKVLDIDERVARAVLAEVGPMIAAQAWDTALDTLEYAIDEYSAGSLPENPHQQEAGR